MHALDEPARWTPDTAVTVLYAAHWGRLVRLAALLTGDASVAEEIVQDAFVALHHRWRRLADPAAACGYLRTCVVNGARSSLRHRVVEERHRQPGPPAPAGPEEHAVRADEDARVLAALRTLAPRQQEVLILRYYADLSEQDIAAALGISRGAVKSHAHRGLANLRQALDDPADPADPGTEVAR
ncbi:MAG: SigE family RNA polymerase sigma factor [Actinomycetales bacterium]|nr:SigE family RNA polymerase sigma factor [Actinomycetales bacterium]